jgi:hypothetical protein
MSDAADQQLTFSVVIPGVQSVSQTLLEGDRPSVIAQQPLCAGPDNIRRSGCQLNASYRLT